MEPASKRPRFEPSSLVSRCDAELVESLGAVDALRLAARAAIDARCREIVSTLTVAHGRMLAKVTRARSVSELRRLNGGLSLALHAESWEATRAELVSAAHNVGFVNVRGLGSPIVDLFASELPIALRFVMKMSGPTSWDDATGRVRWASTLAMFDCKLGRHTILAPTYASLVALQDHAVLGAPPAIERARIKLSEAIARDWCISQLKRRELDAHFDALHASGAAAHCTDVWKAIAAGFGPGCAVDCGFFARFDATKLRVEERGTVVVKLADTQWYPAIASVAMAPNTGRYAWTVDIEADPTTTRGAMLGVCSGVARATTRRMYSGDDAVALSCWGKGYSFGELPTAHIVGPRKWGGAQQGDVIGCVLDTANGALSLSKNGEVLETSIAGLNDKTLFAFVSIYRTGSRVRLRPRRI